MTVMECIQKMTKQELAELLENIEYYVGWGGTLMDTFGGVEGDTCIGILGKECKSVEEVISLGGEIRT